MLQDYLTMMFELAVGFFGLLISVRIIGRRQLSHVTAFDFVSAVVLGEIVGNVPYSNDINWFKMITAIAFWTLLTYMMEIISVKSMRARQLVAGTPAVVIKEGKIQFDVMKKEKLDFNELLSLLRQKDIFSIQEVHYAFVENNGIMTVLPKETNQPNQTSSGGKKSKEPAQPPLTLPIIVDGEILQKNLELFKMTEEDVQKLLIKHGLAKPKQVLYAEYDRSKLFFQLYNDT